MNYKLDNKLKFVLLSIILAIFLSSCSGQALDKLWLKSEGWSRGVLLGDTALASTAEPVIDSKGQVYSILFPRSEVDDNRYQPILVKLSQDGATKEQFPLDFLIAQPRQAKLILRDDHLDLFWIDSNILKVTHLNTNGDQLSEIKLLSTEDRVDHMEVVYWNEGYEIWYSGSKESPGVYGLSGQIDNLKKSVIDPDGIRINLFLDDQSLLHASWANYPIAYGDIEFYYLNPLSQRSDDLDPVLVYTTGISPSRRVDGPVIAIDEEVVYILWSEAIVAGLDAGFRTTYFRYFPIGRPDTIRPPMAIHIPIVANLPASEFDYGTFQTGDRVYVSSGIPSTTSIENIEILNGNFTETAIVFRSRSEFKWRDYRNQTSIAYLSDGLITTYQPLNYTSAESYYPSVVHDQDMNLYVTWLEKGEITYRAYLTTTDPVKKTYIDIVTIDDYLYLGAEGLFGILAGAVLSPFAAAAWGGIGLIGFIFNMIFSQFNKPIYRTIGEILSIITGVGIFWFMKLATLPGLKTWDYVPFSAWIPRIPETLTQPLIYGVPALIALITLAVAYFNTYGKKNGSPINFHLLYTAVDTLLSCAVYGVLIYGSF
ncbi:MAG: hypothetical protein KAH12_09360 [Anaerolineales bacterium]|nr:hypothetical protein [Anaerolineales bacterium]